MLTYFRVVLITGSRLDFRGKNKSMETSQKSFTIFQVTNDDGLNQSRSGGGDSIIEIFR